MIRVNPLESLLSCSLVHHPQIAAIVLAAIYSNEAESHTKEFFQHTIRKYYTTKDRRDAVTLSWDFMMAEVHVLIEGFIGG